MFFPLAPATPKHANEAAQMFLSHLVIFHHKDPTGHSSWGVSIPWPLLTHELSFSDTASFLLYSWLLRILPWPLRCWSLFPIGLVPNRFTLLKRSRVLAQQNTKIYRIYVLYVNGRSSQRLIQLCISGAIQIEFLFNVLFCICSEWSHTELLWSSMIKFTKHQNESD